MAWLEALAQTHGLVPASLRIASADASFRRYLRVDTLAGASLIVIDAAPDKENCEPFVKVAKLMLLDRFGSAAFREREQSLGGGGSETKTKI